MPAAAPAAPIEAPAVAAVVPAPAVAEAPAAIPVTTAAEPVAEPIVVPPAPAPAPAPAPVDLGASLQQAGLVLIETSSAAPRAMVADEAPKLGRKPRPAQVVANEPLQMVETRQE